MLLNSGPVFTSLARKISFSRAPGQFSSHTTSTSKWIYHFLLHVETNNLKFEMTGFEANIVILPACLQNRWQKRLQGFLWTTPVKFCENVATSWPSLLFCVSENLCGGKLSIHFSVLAYQPLTPWSMNNDCFTIWFIQLQVQHIFSHLGVQDLVRWLDSGLVRPMTKLHGPWSAGFPISPPAAGWLNMPSPPICTMHKWTYKTLGSDPTHSAVSWEPDVQW